MAIGAPFKLAFSGSASKFGSTGIFDEQRKHIDTTVEAMRVISDGAHVVVTRQLDLFQILSGQMLSMFASDHLAPEARANQARRCFEAALNGSLEIFHLAVNTSEEALQVLRQRIAGNPAQIVRFAGPGIFGR